MKHENLAMQTLRACTRRNKRGKTCFAKKLKQKRGEKEQLSLWVKFHIKYTQHSQTSAEADIWRSINESRITEQHCCAISVPGINDPAQTVSRTRKFTEKQTFSQRNSLRENNFLLSLTDMTQFSFQQVESAFVHLELQRLLFRCKGPVCRRDINFLKGRPFKCISVMHDSLSVASKDG